MSGWIKLHRKIIHDPVFQNEKLLKVWIYCLLKASHKKHETLVGMQLVEVQPGEFVFGRKKASAELDIKESTLWDQMKLLEKIGNIKIESNNKFSVVNVVNWGLYQDKETSVRQQTNNSPTTKNDDLTELSFSNEESGNNKSTGQKSVVPIDNKVLDSELQQQSDNKPTTNQQQADTNKNVKNGKNVKNSNKPSESNLENDFGKLWELYPNKKSKSKAFQSYKKAIKEGTTNKEIQDGIIAYKKQIKVLGTENQYIAHGSTWFNQKRWEDDYAAKSNSNPSKRFGKQGRKETLPDWAKEDFESSSDEIVEDSALQERLEKIRKMREEQ